MRTTLHVLSIGSEDACNLVRDALIQRQRCHLFVATCFRELCAIRAGELFEIAILHWTLSSSELREAGEYIRRRWPEAKILVIRRTTVDLEDPLYDEWTPPSKSPEALLDPIEHLINGMKPNSLNHRPSVGTKGSE